MTPSWVPYFLLSLASSLKSTKNHHFPHFCTIYVSFHFFLSWHSFNANQKSNWKKGKRTTGHEIKNHSKVLNIIKRSHLLHLRSARTLKSARRRQCFLDCFCFVVGWAGDPSSSFYLQNHDVVEKREEGWKLTHDSVALGSFSSWHCIY